MKGRTTGKTAQPADAACALATESEKQTAAQWIKGALDEAPPFSFLYNGEPFGQLLGKWLVRRAAVAREDGAILNTRAYRDPVSGLECILELTGYPGCSAAEWVVRFRNHGPKDTGIVSEVRALDVVLPCPAGSQPRLYYSKGTRAAIDDFALQEQAIPEGGKLDLASFGSRAYLPFFNLDLAERGVIAAIGWTGNWSCAFQRPAKGAGVGVRAGMAKTNLRLHPGEEIRTPRMLLLFWQGDRIRGHNLLRRHLVAHHLPRPGGREVEAPICNSTWGGMKTANHLKTIQFIKDNGLEYDCYWMDAGWYGPDHKTEEFQNFYTEDWCYNIGHWRVNRMVHPDGLRPIVTAAHAAGMKVLLWFSPYAGEAGSPIVKEHPEWLVSKIGWGAQGVGLNPKPLTLFSFDLGIPEARQFLVDYISKLIAEHGVDYFRDDGGLPLPEAERDAPDRQGLGEIRCVEGFYAFWDELLRRHPGMLIDNCGGGGTRIDLETIGRSLVLHRTDYNCHPEADPIGFQVGTHGLSHWVPLVGGCTPPRPGNTYNLRSGWCGGLPFSLFPAGGFGKASTAPIAEYPVDWHRKMLAEYRRVRPYFKGDFYPLTNCTVSPKDWFAYQMDRPDLGAGLVVAFRREDSPFESARFKLRGLEQSGAYRVANLDPPEAAVEMTGKELMESGLPVTMARAPQAVSLVYQRAK